MSAPDYPSLLRDAEKRLGELTARVRELEGLLAPAERAIAAVEAAKYSRVTTGSTNQ